MSWRDFAGECDSREEGEVNDNLQQQAFALFEQLLLTADDGECSVADIAHLNPKRALAKNQEAKCIEMSQLSTSGAFPSGWEKRPFNGGMRFSNGDTLLARITPCLENGKAAFIDFLDTSEVAFGSTEYIVLAPKGEIPPEFLYCLARYPLFSDYAVKNMNGSSGRQRVSAETIGQFKLPRPSTNKLKRFGNVVSSLFLKMRFNSLENMRLSSLRDSLLPKLMSAAAWSAQVPARRSPSCGQPRTRVSVFSVPWICSAWMSSPRSARIRWNVWAAALTAPTGRTGRSRPRAGVPT